MTASNPAGQQSHDRQATLFVDTVAPAGSVSVHGRKQTGSRLHLYIAYADRPPTGEPPAAASGVAKVLVQWGDRTTTRLRLGRHRSFHAYRRPGRYRVTVTVTDKAGNVKRVVSVIKVTKPKSTGK